jgi:hypothetical protein
MMTIGGALRHGFGEWRWVYLMISCAAVAVPLMNNRPWPLYLAAVVTAGYFASAASYAILAWIVMPNPQSLPLSQWLFAIFFVPTHLVFMTSAFLAGLLALAIRRQLQHA